jgi:hypothetical protein
MFDVTLQSDVRKVPVETSVSAQLYVMTPDSLCCSGKDNRPQNQHREGGNSGGVIIKMCTSITSTSC